MKEKEDIFEKAVESLRRQEVPPGPPQDLVDATMARLAEPSGSPAGESEGTHILQLERLKVFRGFGKVAAAAVVLITAGYAAGRWSAPRPPDMEQIRAAIEPAIRQELLNETKQYVQLSLANGYLQVKEQLSEQFRQDMSRSAIQTLAASNTITNELLAQFIESVNAAQTVDRQRVAAALQEIELNRLRDRSQLSNAFATLAVRTGDELIQTKKDVAQVLSYAGLSVDGPDGAAPYKLQNPTNPDERNQQ